MAKLANESTHILKMCLCKARLVGRAFNFAWELEKTDKDLDMSIFNQCIPKTSMSIALSPIC